MQQVTRGLVNCRLSSLSNPSFSCAISAFVLSKLTTYRTPKITAPSEWTHLTGLDLADPHFAGGSRIDLLLGADVYAQLILEALRRGPLNAPVAQRTKLGWIFTGKLSLRNHKLPPIHHRHCTVLRRIFWGSAYNVSGYKRRLQVQGHC